MAKIKMSDAVARKKEAYRETIGRRIRLRRDQLDMTQEELAQRLGYKSKTSINKIELGKQEITQSKIPEFAAALGITVGQLMGWEGYDWYAKNPATIDGNEEHEDAIRRGQYAYFIDLLDRSTPEARDAAVALLISKLQNQ